MQPELAPVGGILRPYSRSGVISTDHVNYALSDVLADVVAMKVTTGNLTRAKSKRLVSGMTPTHVFNRLQDALRLVDAMITKG